MNECVRSHDFPLRVSFPLLCVSLFSSYEFIQGSAELNLQTYSEINMNVNVFLYCHGWETWFGLIFMHKNISEIYEVRQTTAHCVICVL